MLIILSSMHLKHYPIIFRSFDFTYEYNGNLRLSILINMLFIMYIYIYRVDRRVFLFFYFGRHRKMRNHYWVLNVVKHYYTFTRDTYHFQ